MNMICVGLVPERPGAVGTRMIPSKEYTRRCALDSRGALDFSSNFFMILRLGGPSLFPSENSSVGANLRN